jgi:hypothetical protein
MSMKNLLPWNRRASVTTPRQWLLLKLAGNHPVAVNLDIEGRIANVDRDTHGLFWNLRTTHQSVEGLLKIEVTDGVQR